MFEFDYFIRGFHNKMFSKSLTGQFCSQITNTLFDDPVAGIFRVPAYQSDQDPYLQYIQKPMDFGTIKKKLKDNSYFNINDWKQDVELVFSNAVEYNTAQSLIGGIALHLKRKYEKLLERFNLSNKQNYEERLRKLYRELQVEMTKSYSIQLDQTLTPEYTTKQLAEKLSSVSDSAQIEEILKTHGYESMIKGKGKSNINLDNIKRACLDDLWRLANK